MGTQKNILIADDTAEIRALITDVLEHKGYNIMLATNGTEALKTITTNPVDLLITDILMPEMDGIELTTAALKILPKLKVILISGGGETNNYDYLSMAKKLTGIVNILEKPFSIKDIEELVSKTLTVNEAEQ